MYEFLKSLVSMSLDINFPSRGLCPLFFFMVLKHLLFHFKIHFCSYNLFFEDEFFFFFFCHLAIPYHLTFWRRHCPWTVAPQAPLSSTICHILFKFMCVESVMLYNHLILYFPLLHLPSILPSERLF